MSRGIVTVGVGNVKGTGAPVPVLYFGYPLQLVVNVTDIESVAVGKCIQFAVIRVVGISSKCMIPCGDPCRVPESVIVETVNGSLRGGRMCGDR